VIVQISEVETTARPLRLRYDVATRLGA
jgi:hypothetical protein